MISSAEPATEAAPKLSEILFRKNPRGFDSMAALPSNVQALDHALQFAIGRQRFVAIVGPSGWGKSHLLEAVATTMRQKDRSSNVEITSATDWALNQSRVDPQAVLLLDDAQMTMDRSKLRLQLRLGLERRVKANRPTVVCFTAPKLTRQIRFFMPRTRSWMFGSIGAPEVCEREVVVRNMSEAQDLKLSPSLVQLLAKKLNGDGRTLLGALKRLQLQQSTWLSPKMTLQACGVLNPFFADNSSWDLREHILEVAEKSTPGDRELKQELALYTMLKVALLAESDVARYFEVEPAHVYARAVAFERRLKEGDPSTKQLHQFIEQVVEALESE